MSQYDGSVRSISWRDLFPWTIIFRTLPIAFSIPVIILALIGVAVVPMGWKVSRLAFVNSEVNVSDQDLTIQADNLREFSERMESPYQSVFQSSRGESTIKLFGARISGPVLVFRQIVEPFWHIFRDQGNIWSFLYYLVGALWTLAVWSFVGCGIARIAVVRLARDEEVGLDGAFQYMWQSGRHSFVALLLPLIAIVVLCIPTFLAGLLMTFDFGFLVVSIFFILIQLLAIVMAILLLGLTFGWPLAVAAVGTEGHDPFDAMTRSFAYTFQRPLHYAFYAFVAVMFGGFCWLIVARLVEGVENLSYWSASWGVNVFDANRMDEIREMSDHVFTEGEESPGKIKWAGTRILAFWNGFLRSIAAAFLFGQFWCLAAAVYLLLRRDLDETEMDEVFVSEEQRTYDLPPLKSEQGQIPELGSIKPADKPDGNDTGQPLSQDSKINSDEGMEPPGQEDEV